MHECDVCLLLGTNFPFGEFYPNKPQQVQVYRQASRIGRRTHVDMGREMRNPWLAIDVTMSPTSRARELRLAWERHLGGEEILPEVRAPIRDSWRRSTAVIHDPSHWTIPIELDERQAAERLAAHPLARLLPFLRRTLGAIARDAGDLILLSDADGLLLAVEGDARLRLLTADWINLRPGARWSEEGAGTNAIGTALVADHALQVFAAEHFSERLHWFTGVAEPIHDPGSGATLGAVGIIGRMEMAHPHSLGLLSSVVTRLEADLRASLQADERDAARASSKPSWRISGDDASGERGMLGQASDSSVPPVLPWGGGDCRAGLMIEALGRDRARVTFGDARLVVSQRHSEIVVLLAAHPAGMTGEQLAIALYGDDGKPATARAELSRLKRLLGDCVQTDPYRLGAPVVSDIGTVRRLLRDGEVEAALAYYRGPVLPRSEAPAIADVRNELEGWTRRSVVASDDIDTLWSWLRRPSGEDDIQGWKRFLAGLPLHDGRRGLAAARLERLRGLEAVPERPGRFGGPPRRSRTGRLGAGKR